MDNSGFALTILNRARAAAARRQNAPAKKSEAWKPQSVRRPRKPLGTAYPMPRFDAVEPRNRPRQKAGAEPAAPFSCGSMFFWLKKLIGYWITPVPALAALLVLGLVLLRFPRRARAGRVLLTVATVLFVLLGNKAVSAWLVRPLETKYAAIPELREPTLRQHPLADAKYVVVLGGGNGHMPGLAALDELSASARARITEAVRILRLLPEAKLLVSGPADVYSPTTHATVLERAAISLGIDASRIERIEHARDTEDEAAATRTRIGSAPVILVTSAWHMPRAMALFKSAGLTPVPAPTDYTSYSDGHLHWRDALWDVESIERSTVAIRERIGYLWISLRGKG
jgi:uncharacterized SAM-binding protein YcdF (DUF218 family)